MTRLPPSSALSLIPPMDAVARHMPAHTHLDFLGRMPIPLRRAFKSGLDQTTATHRQASGESLHCCFLSGTEWYRPFDTLSSDPVDTLPGMLVSTFYHDILNPALLAHYTPATSVAPRPSHPACAAAGLDDAGGVQVGQVDHHPWREAVEIAGAVWLVGQDAAQAQGFHAHVDAVAYFQVQRGQQSGFGPGLTGFGTAPRLFFGIGLRGAFQFAAQWVDTIRRLDTRQLNAIVGGDDAGKLHH